MPKAIYLLKSKLSAMLMGAQAIGGHSNFFGTTRWFFFVLDTALVLIACYAIYLELSIDTQLVLESFQLVFVQLQSN